MPDAKNNAKLTGDTHLPDLDEGDDLDDIDDDSPEGRDLADGARPGKGENQAGTLRDKDKTG